MGKKNSVWIQKHKRDPYFREAKKKGFRSRSAFKLLQITNSYRLLKQGHKVVDLGAAPGGWIQVARNIVGDNGQILGIDVSPIKPFEFENVKTLKLNVNDQSLIDKILEEDGKVDVVVSDLSISMSGIRSLDIAKQIHLTERSFEIASRVLVKHGNFLVKTFESPEAQQFFKKIKNNFKRVKFVKPQASKSESSEIYLIGLGFRDL